jgi:hypothetical protein
MQASRLGPCSLPLRTGSESRGRRRRAPASWQSDSPAEVRYSACSRACFGGAAIESHVIFPAMARPELHHDFQGGSAGIAHERPANRGLPTWCGLARSRWIPLVPRGFGTPPGPRSPNESAAPATPGRPVRRSASRGSRTHGTRLPRLASMTRGLAHHVRRQPTPSWLCATLGSPTTRARRGSSRPRARRGRWSGMTVLLLWKAMRSGREYYPTPAHRPPSPPARSYSSGGEGWRLSLHRAHGGPTANGRRPGPRVFVAIACAKQRTTPVRRRRHRVSPAVRCS